MIQHGGPHENRAAIIMVINMQNFLSYSTAAYGAGLSPGKRIFKVPGGMKAGRLAILMATSPSVIKLAYADFPYREWTVAGNAAVDSADFPFDAVMDAEGNIYLAYTTETDKTLVVARLILTANGWSFEGTSTVHNADENYFPSLMLETNGGRLWVSWCRQIAGQEILQAKYSSDGGQSWSTEPDDPGYEISSGTTTVYSKLIILGSYLYCLYARQGERLACRRKHVNVTQWEDEADIITGSGCDGDFDAAISADGRLAVVFDDGQLGFREFDGREWSGILTVDENGGYFPQVQYCGTVPVVVYLSEFQGVQRGMKYSRRESSGFSISGYLDPAKAVFDKVLGYNAGRADFQDLTAAAANDTPGDMFHPANACLLKEIGDALYLGMTRRFHYLKIIMSVAGVGGTISAQYFNGLEWVAFVPSGGQYNGDVLDREWLLWEDYVSIPTDWMKTIIEGNHLYWIRLVVTDPFLTGPIGSQVTTIANPEGVILMEP